MDFAEHIWHAEVLFLRNRQGFDLALVPDVQPASFPKWFHFGFRLADSQAVRDLHARMAAGGQTISTPLQEEPDFVWFRCQDPAGHQIEIYWE
jgi:catechol 2,3-dioxygenase-like lactoylglutathione lyase family enzyme